jgi:hypothetical protein
MPTRCTLMVTPIVSHVVTMVRRKMMFTLINQCRQ